MTVRLGMSSFVLSWSVGVPGYPQPARPLDVFDILQTAHDLGLHVVQIADNLPLHRLTGEQAQRLADEAEQLQIEIEVGTRGIATPHLLDYIDIASFYGSQILRVVMDTADHHPSIDEAATLLRAVMPACEAAGVTMAVENHDRFRARELVALIQAVDHPRIGIALDTVNSFGALEGPEVVVPTLAPYVVNLHLKEFIVRRLPHNMGFVVVGAPAGAGMMNVPWLLEQLAERTFNAIIEAWPPEEVPIEAAMARETAWLRSSVDYLRGLIPD